MSVLLPERCMFRPVAASWLSEIHKSLRVRWLRYFFPQLTTLVKMIHCIGSVFKTKTIHRFVQETSCHVNYLMNEGIETCICRWAALPPNWSIYISITPKRLLRRDWIGSVKCSSRNFWTLNVHNWIDYLLSDKILRLVLSLYDCFLSSVNHTMKWGRPLCSPTRRKPLKPTWAMSCESVWS